MATDTTTPSGQINIGTAEAPLYVPEGSAGAQLSLATGANKQAIQSYQTQTGEIAPPSIANAYSPLAQVDMSESPPVDPSVASGAYNTSASAQGFIASTPTEEDLIDERDRIEQQQSEMQTTGLQKLLGQKPTPPSYQEIQSQAFSNLGLPQDFIRETFQKLQQKNEEIAALDKQLADINTQEQKSLLNIEGQQIPMENISRQQQQAMRGYAIQKMSVSADIQLKMAEAANLKGEFDMVNQSIDQFAKFATYDYQQKLADFNWMRDTYRDQFNDLTKRDQQLFDELVRQTDFDRTQKEQEAKDKVRLYLDARLPLPDTNTLKNQSYEDAARYVSQNSYVKPIEVSPGTTLYDPQTRRVIFTAPGRTPIGTDSLSISGLTSQQQSTLSRIGLSAEEQSVVAGIYNGTQPPLSGYGANSRQGIAVKAGLNALGYDLTKATNDWNAVQRWIQSSNSTQQLRMRQAENSVKLSLDSLQQLNNDYIRSGYKFVNKLDLVAATNGIYGQDAAKKAQAILGQISLITDELGQTFMGGNSPTDQAFKLAAGVLQGNFSRDVLNNQIQLIRQNLQYRENSWTNSGVVSVGGGTNQYVPQNNSGANTNLSDQEAFSKIQQTIGQSPQSNQTNQKGFFGSLIGGIKSLFGF